MADRWRREMTRGRKLLLAGATVIAVSVGGAGMAQAVGGDSEEQVSGPAADRAERAAIEAVGGGRTVGLEREDDGRDGWEVEVERGGRTLEVHLGQDLRQTGVERDDDSGDEPESGDDD
jgi:hypothetical protein